MATSGSTDFTVTRDDIIKASLRILGGIGAGETPSTAQTTEAGEALNMLCKAMPNDGKNLWTRAWIQVTLSDTDIVSNGGSNYYCVKSHTSGSTTEPGVGANWTSVWEITTDTAGGAWSTSTAYNYIGDFSMPSGYNGVEQAFVREKNGSSVSDYDLVMSSWGDYLSIIDKRTSGGIPTSVYFDEGLSTNTGYLYPTPEDTDQVVHVMAIRTIEDFDSSTDNPDFPANWFEVLKFGLAYRLAPEYGHMGQNLAQYSDMYEQALKAARNDDKEVTLRFASPTYAV